MILIAYIGLSTPAMLGGLLLLSLPIIAHFLNRHARLRIVFPTLQLLQASAATQSNLYRLRRWILLLLRCLAIALIVTAFARPVWLDADTDNSRTSNGTAVVLVIDISGSSHQQADGVALVHRLRVSAHRTLASLKSGSDLANIVYATAQPFSTFPRLSPNLPALREELNQIEATYERADLPKAIALAGQQLSKHDGPRRLVILSDLQRTNWQDVIERADAAQFLPPKTLVTVVDSSQSDDNVSISSPRHFPTQPLVGQSTQLLIHASNFNETAKQVRIELFIDGKAVSNQTVTLTAGEQRDVAFETTVPDTRDHEITFKIPADALDLDNHAYLVVRARDRLPVVIVSDDDANDIGTAAYFLSRALAPHADKQSDRFEVRHVSSSQLAASDLTEASAVFVGYVAELNMAACEKLMAYMRQGGGVLFFCGEGAVVRNLATLEQSAREDGGVLPWTPARARHLATADEVVFITNGKWQSRLLREFDEQSQVAISQIRFERLWSAGPAKPEAQVLLTFSNGPPALAARRVGIGQFLLANFSPSLESSDLGKYGSFVALMQIMATQLRSNVKAETKTVVGDSYRHPKPFPLAAGAAKLMVVDPQDNPIPTRLTRVADHVSVEIDATHLPGFYRIQQGGKTIALAAVNVDERERDLRRIDHETLMNHFQSDGMKLEVHSTAGWDPILNLHGRPLWGWFFAAAMCAVGLELICLGVWKR